MNTILSALANGLVLSTILAAVVWLALRLLKRSFNAATRYAIWWIALLPTIVLPVIFLTAPHKRNIEPRRISGDSTTISANPFAASPSNSTNAIAQTKPTKISRLPSIPIYLPSGGWTERFGEMWALISLLLLARLAAGFVALHRQKKYAREAPPGLSELMARCLTRRGIKRRVRVVLVRDGSSPMLAGVIRPFVLIPERLLSELDQTEIEQILLHEATHAARYDDWALLLQRVIQAVLSFYPVVHWLAQRINLEREAACDAGVISVTGDARAYAKCLTHVAEFSSGYWKSPLAAAIADEKSYLARRIHMLFDKNRDSGTCVLTIRLALAAAALCLLAALAATSPAFFVSAQSPDTAADWEKAAGGKMAFDATSVKQSVEAPFTHPLQESNVSLNPQGDNASVGDTFMARGWRLFEYIRFAYKLTPDQTHEVQRQLPNWASTHDFDIDARAQGNSTRDQMRLMMQSLLADRFKMVIHMETRQSARYALVLDKPGKTGPQLKPHSDGTPCPSAASSAANSLARPCPQFTTTRSTDREVHLIGYNVTMQQVASYLYAMPGPHVPILDRTQLAGAFDFKLDYTPESFAGAPLNADSTSDGPTPREALQDELGLKLEQTAIPVDTLVIDHIEEPTPN